MKKHKICDLVSKIVVDKKQPGEHANFIIKECRGAKVRQQNWKK